MRTASHTPLVDRSIGGHFITVPAQTIALDPKATSPYQIRSFYADMSAGTCTIAIQINGTNVTGLGSISASTTGATTTATAANNVALGDRVTMVITSPSGAADLEWVLEAVG